MTKKKPFGTHLKRGRKGVYMGTNKADAKGNQFINISFSTMPKASKRGKRVSVIGKSKKWTESVGAINGGNLSSNQLNKILGIRANIAGATRALHRVQNDVRMTFGSIKPGDFKRGSRIPKAWIDTYERATREIKSSTQKLLKMTENGEKSPFMRHEYNERGKLVKFNIGFRGGGKDAWLRSITDTKRTYFGIRSFDIQRAVKNYGKGIIPNQDVIKYSKRKGANGELIKLGTIKSMASTGVWWRDVKHVSNTGKVTWERKLDKELESRLFAKMKERAEAKFRKRHAADPLMGTRKRGRKAFEKSTWKPSWLKKIVPEQWAAKEALRSSFYAKHIGGATQYHPWQRINVPKGVSSKIRRIRTEIIKKAEIATVEAQAQLMRELEYVKNWSNLTGNAYTGIVSAAYVTTDMVTVRKIYEQMPGVNGRRATRGKLSNGVYKRYYRKENGTKKSLKHKNAHVYIGKYFDNPSQYFFIKDRGQFESTSGGFAYKEALSMLNAFNPRMTGGDSSGTSKLKGVVASIKVVSGTPEYIDRLSTASGGSIMMYALQRAEEILGQKIKQIMQ